MDLYRTEAFPLEETIQPSFIVVDLVAWNMEPEGNYLDSRAAAALFRESVVNALTFRQQQLGST